MLNGLLTQVRVIDQTLFIMYSVELWPVTYWIGCIH